MTARDLPSGWIGMPRVGCVRFRVVDGSIVVQRPMIERVFATCPVLLTSGAVYDLAQQGRVGSAVALLVGAVSVTGVLLHAVLRNRVLVDQSGWRLRRGRTVAWDEVQEIVIYRGANRMGDFIWLRGDARVPFAGFVPRVMHTFRPDRWNNPAVDVFCHLQHDVAHLQGERPVPVVVDMGRDVPRVGLVHPCSICNAAQNENAFSFG